MAFSRRAAALAAGSALVLSTLASLSFAQATKSASGDRKKPESPRQPIVTTKPAEVCGECRFTPTVIMTPIATTITGPVHATKPLVPNDGGELPGGVAGICPEVISTWTNADFTGGSYIVEAGFAEQEMAAASYTLSPDQFPLRIDLTEMIFATSGTNVTTTTKWSVLFFEGNPDTGQVIASFSSDGDIIPDLVIPPGTNGTNVQFQIDPSDPDQIIIQDNSTHSFSVAYRIDKHNNQTQNPCFVAPPTNSNAFPTVDVGGLQAPTTNWLYAINCGPFGCPAGWKKFSQLGLCKPSGDWVLRVTWTPINCVTSGACCLPSGNCDILTQTACQSLGGTYLGDNSSCSIGGCQSSTVACCFAATGGCLNLLPQTCLAAGGVPGPGGSNCAGYICFQQGACCLPNGSCVGPVSPETCAAQGGIFQGNNSSCQGANCPQPTGACCFATGFCLTLKQADCALAGATWKGAGTTCADGNGNGIADACEQGNPADLNNDGHVNAQDLAILLGAWGQTSGVADINDDGAVNATDLSILLGAWG